MHYLTIQQLSQKPNIPKHTLRFWEKEFVGILVPSRTNGRQRRHTSEDVSLIERINGLRKGGMSLTGIRERLSDNDKGEYQNSYKIDLLANGVSPGKA